MNSCSAFVQSGREGPTHARTRARARRPPTHKQGRERDQGGRLHARVALSFLFALSPAGTWPAECALLVCPPRSAQPPLPWAPQAPSSSSTPAVCGDGPVRSKHGGGTAVATTAPQALHRFRLLCLQCCRRPHCHRRGRTCCRRWPHRRRAQPAPHLCCNVAAPGTDLLT